MCRLSVPFPIVIICSDLSSLVNGNVHYGGAGSSDSRPVDTVATYNCNTGYTLNGDSTTRTCGSDGVWSGSAQMDFLLFDCFVHIFQFRNHVL